MVEGVNSVLKRLTPTEWVTVVAPGLLGVAGVWLMLPQQTWKSVDVAPSMVAAIVLSVVLAFWFGELSSRISNIILFAILFVLGYCAGRATDWWWNSFGTPPASLDRKDYDTDRSFLERRNDYLQCHFIYGKGQFIIYRHVINYISGRVCPNTHRYLQPQKGISEGFLVRAIDSHSFREFRRIEFVMASATMVFLAGMALRFGNSDRTVVELSNGIAVTFGQLSFLMRTLAIVAITVGVVAGFIALRRGLTVYYLSLMDNEPKFAEHIAQFNFQVLEGMHAMSEAEQVQSNSSKITSV